MRVYLLRQELTVRFEFLLFPSPTERMFQRHQSGAFFLLQQLYPVIHQQGAEEQRQVNDGIAEQPA